MPSELAYAGANAGTSTVPASSDLLFEADDALLTGGGKLESELDEDVKKEVKSGEDGNDLYDSVAGQLSLVNVLPNGTVAPHATFGSAPSGVTEPPDFSHVISADGSRIFWTDLNTGANDRLRARERDSTCPFLRGRRASGRRALMAGTPSTPKAKSSGGSTSKARRGKNSPAPAPKCRA